MPSAALFVGNLLYHSLPDWLESVREYQFGPDDIAAAFCNISNAPAFFGLSASERRELTTARSKRSLSTYTSPRLSYAFQESGYCSVLKTSNAMASSSFLALII